MKTHVYNLENKVVGEIDLPKTIFGVPWKPTLVEQVLRAQLANRRRPWAHAKGRGEVRGGGRKPWRQKGTGRARHGSTRSPIWVHGGKAHGPNKMRDYSQKINKKMRRLSMFSVLSKKFADTEVKVFDALKIDAPKTKILSSHLRPILGLTKNLKKFDVLLIVGRENKNIARASSNLPKAMAVTPESINLYDLINHKNIFIERDAIATLGGHYYQKNAV